jgi:chemotaxis signal transduction protein
VRGAPATRGERLLTFEVGGGAYALPIADVLEVSEVARFGRVPGLPSDVGGVMHYHGDALPIVSRAAVFETPAGGFPEPEHVVVVSDASGEAARLGLPVDRVLGLADAVLSPAHARELVVARLPLDGRVTGVLDAGVLVRRAAEAIARAQGSGVPNPEHGGET